MLIFMQSTRYSCQILMKLEFSQHIFENYSNIKFHENPSSGTKTGCLGGGGEQSTCRTIYLTDNL